LPAACGRLSRKVVVRDMGDGAGDGAQGGRGIVIPVGVNAEGGLVRGRRPPASLTIAFSGLGDGISVSISVANRSVSRLPNTIGSRFCVAASSVLDDASKSISDLLQIGRLHIDPAQSGLCVGDRRGDRLIDLMGDRGRQLPMVVMRWAWAIACRSSSARRRNCRSLPCFTSC
jgi:hypothetical protein